MPLRSPGEDVVIPDGVTLPQFIMAVTEMHGDKIALVNGVTGETYTFADFRKYATSVASALARRGIRKGDTVAIFSTNCPEFAIVLVGAMLTGATVTTASSAFVAAELARQLTDSWATYTFASENLINVAKQGAKLNGKQKEIIVFGNSPGCTPLKQLLQDDGTAFPEDVDINVKEDTAFLPYSSGTTGLPKGVMVTHYNIMANLIQLSSPYIRGPEPRTTPDVILGLLPCYHAYGMFVILIGGLAGGNQVVLLPRFHPKSFFKAIEKYKVTFLPLVPPIVNFMAKYKDADKYDLSSVERIGTGAAPLSIGQEEAFRKKYKTDELKQGYGLTESTICLCAAQFGEWKRGSVGKPIPNTELKVIDVDTGKELGPNERGEICGRGPQIMKGYHNQPKKTAEVIDGEGWFHTGDIGYYDDDGYVFIVDRIKELIKYKGLQVAPAELEGILMGHPSIQDCGVTSIPDVDAGELPRAYVVKRQGTPDITADDIHKFMEGQIAPFKRLRGGVEFVSEIPKAPSGKILRRLLKERAQKSRL